jgi:hypothetical protein
MDSIPIAEVMLEDRLPIPAPFPGRERGRELGRTSGDGPTKDVATSGGGKASSRRCRAFFRIGNQFNSATDLLRIRFEDTGLHFRAPHLVRSEYP